MTTTDLIENLFKRGVVAIDIGTVPDTKDTRYVKATQIVATGPSPNHQQITHQVSHGGLPELLSQVSRQVDHANELKSEIIQLRKQ